MLSNSQMSALSPKRGWIGVATRTVNDYSRPGEVRKCEKITVGVITSIARDGTIKRMKPIDGATEMTNDYAHGGWARILTIDPARFPDGGTAFLAIAAARQTPDPKTWAPWESLDDVRAVARQCGAQ